MHTRFLDLAVGESSVSDGVNISQRWVTPIPDSLYSSFVNAWFWNLEEIVVSEPDDIFDIVTTDLTFAIFLAQHFHINAVRNYCSSNNIELRSGRHFKPLIDPNWVELGNWYEYEITSTNKIKESLRSLYYTSKYNKDVYGSLPGSSLLGCDVHSIGRLDWMKKEWLASNHRAFSQYEPGLLLSGKTLRDKNVTVFSRKIIRPLFESLHDEFDEFFAGVDLEKVVAAWGKRLSILSDIYYRLLDRKRKPSVLLVTGGTNPFRKVMVSAYQRAGVDVKVFQHGNDIAARIQEHGHRVEVSHTKEFVCPNRKIASLYETVYRSIPIEKRSGTNYTSISTNYYGQLTEKTRSEPLLSPTSIVMIVGRPLNNLRLLDANGGFFLHKVDLEMQLISIFNNLGYSTIYKAHPEWVDKAKLLYQTMGCMILDRNFEEQYKKASILVFTTATTTSFGYGLCTNKSIVLLDAEGNRWQTDVKKKLSQRCEILEYKTASNGAALIHESEIVHAIENANNKQEDERFIREYLWGQ